MEVIKGGVVPEARQALTNMGEIGLLFVILVITLQSPGHILEAANCTFDNVVKTTVLLADINDFGAVNEVYTKFFSDNYPARAAYQVPEYSKVSQLLSVKRDIYCVLSARWRPCPEVPGWK